MPGPFPGMDPYLENPVMWPDLHHSFITYARAALRAVLPPGYIAVVEERVYVIPSRRNAERSLVPDVFVRPRPTKRSGQEIGSVALAEASDAPHIVRVSPAGGVEQREGYIQIVDARDREHVITTIELLSPTNKTAGHPGHSVYVRKQQAILGSDAHLLEIGLLRAGEHTVAVPLSTLAAECGDWDYLVCLHRVPRTDEYEVWPVRLQQRLPCVRVPLEAGLPDVSLNLQAVLNRCYEEAGYGDMIDYGQLPTPTLNVEDAAWAEGLLRESGLRP